MATNKSKTMFILVDGKGNIQRSESDFEKLVEFSNNAFDAEQREGMAILQVVKVWELLPSKSEAVEFSLDDYGW